MIQFHALLLSCALVLAGGASAPSAASPRVGRPLLTTLNGHTARADITAAYDQISDAGRRHDLERIMSYLTPDYAEVDAQGVTWDRGQVRTQYQDWLSRVHTMQGRYVIQGLTVTSGGALVDVQAHIAGTGEKRLLLARIEGTFTNDLLVRDLWVRTPVGWRLKHRQTLSSQTQMRPR